MRSVQRDALCTAFPPSFQCFRKKSHPCARDTQPVSNFHPFHLKSKALTLQTSSPSTPLFPPPPGSPPSPPPSPLPKPYDPVRASRPPLSPPLLPPTSPPIPPTESDTEPDTSADPSLASLASPEAFLRYLSSDSYKKRQAEEREKVDGSYEVLTSCPW